jgi:hypothetical protein
MAEALARADLATVPVHYGAFHNHRAAAVARVGWSGPGRVRLARSMPVAYGPAPDHDDGAPSASPVVFVSYCREDAEWLRRFAVMLKPEVRNRPPVLLWHDTLIGAGQVWRPELEDAIGRTVVALLWFVLQLRLLMR